MNLTKRNSKIKILLGNECLLGLCRKNDFLYLLVFDGKIIKNPIHLKNTDEWDRTPALTLVYLLHRLIQTKINH
jgi:hypothetical protein